MKSVTWATIGVVLYFMGTDQPEPSTLVRAGEVRWGFWGGSGGLGRGFLCIVVFYFAFCALMFHNGKMNTAFFHVSLLLLSFSFLLFLTCHLGKILYMTEACFPPVCWPTCKMLPWEAERKEVKGRIYFSIN